MPKKRRTAGPGPYQIEPKTRSFALLPRARCLRGAAGDKACYNASACGIDKGHGGRGRMKTMYILLMRSCTPLSRIVHLVTGAQYTHVSLAFDETLEPLYSSTRKNGEDMFPAGPCEEHLNRGYLKRHPSIPCALYRISVTEGAFEQARAQVERFMAHSDRYAFNIAGLLFCMLGVPLRRERKYFCSQFVSEVLDESGALALPKEPCLMKPSDYASLLESECCYTGALEKLIEYVDRGASAATSPKRA